MTKSLFAAFLVGAAAASLLGGTLAAQATPNPIRWNSGGAVWSTPQGPSTPSLRPAR